MSAPSSSAPQPIAPAPSISFGAASAAGFGSTASPAAPPAAFSGFAQSAATPSSPLTANFGAPRQLALIVEASIVSCVLCHESLVRYLL
jgi:hypothetical protein